MNQVYTLSPVLKLVQDRWEERELVRFLLLQKIFSNRGKGVDELYLFCQKLNAVRDVRRHGIHVARAQQGRFAIHKEEDLSRYNVSNLFVGMRVGRVRLGGRSVIEFHGDYHQMVRIGEIAAPSRRNRFRCDIGSLQNAHDHPSC